VELVVRLVPGGIGSTYLHNLRAGDSVTFTGPFGEFRLSEDPATELVCVAGGCGLAPVKSILWTACARWPARPLWLFFGCRARRDLLYFDEFKALAARHPALQVVYALSDPLAPGETWDGDLGFIHLAVDKHLPAAPGAKRQAFLCGPEPMIVAVTKVLESKGLRAADIFYDKF
jgi:Na+-transporting NADH:ubiquinone oxidoreductase subunit F